MMDSRIKTSERKWESSEQSSEKMPPSSIVFYYFYIQAILANQGKEYKNLSETHFYFTSFVVFATRTFSFL